MGQFEKNLGCGVRKVATELKVVLDGVVLVIPRTVVASVARRAQGEGLWPYVDPWNAAQERRLHEYRKHRRTRV